MTAASWRNRIKYESACWAETAVVSKTKAPSGAMAFVRMDRQGSTFPFPTQFGETHSFLDQRPELVGMGKRLSLLKRLLPQTP
jgi:hypothetical protein